jgi:hypothetical protein
MFKGSVQRKLRGVKNSGTRWVLPWAGALFILFSKPLLVLVKFLFLVNGAQLIGEF